MMKLKQYQVDAFTDVLFSGNPAAVVPLDRWLDDKLLQAIAEENNLSETAFFVPDDQAYQLRWFTPKIEVDLCGHATLATAYVLFEILGVESEKISFETRSGRLSVERKGGFLQMDFPAQPAKECVAHPVLFDAIGQAPEQVLAAEDYLLVYKDESAVRSLQPDFNQLCDVDLRGVIVTAPGDEVDFVSRFFAPKYGVVEDPVTGSAHCTLTPYWSRCLHKQRLDAVQVSKRGGKISCELREDRVVLSGKAVIFMQAEIQVP